MLYEVITPFPLQGEYEVPHRRLEGDQLEEVRRHVEAGELAEGAAAVLQRQGAGQLLAADQLEVLEDAAKAAIELLGALQDPFAGFGRNDATLDENRITSYNVCYTKLLRARSPPTRPASRGCRGSEGRGALLPDPGT